MPMIKFPANFCYRSLRFTFTLLIDKKVKAGILPAFKLIPSVGGLVCGYVSGLTPHWV